MIEPTAKELTAITSALTAGNTRLSAAAFAGVEYAIFATWMDELPTFASAVAQAEATAVVHHVAIIAKAAQDGKWGASAWWLQHRQEVLARESAVLETLKLSLPDEAPEEAPDSPDKPKRTAAYRFTPRRREAYLGFLREGYRRGAAAQACGVSRQIVNRHIKDDDEFASEVDRAEMDANEVVENALFEAAKSGNVTAAQVWLYNRNPGRWADRRNIKAEVSGPDGGPVPVRLVRVLVPAPTQTEEASA